MSKILLCFGLGYSATALAQHLIDQGWTIRGTSRDPGKLKDWAKAGITGFRFDRDHPLPSRAFLDVSHVLTSIMPDETGDPVLDGHAADLARLDGLSWIGYLGTTAVYGDRNGGWVNETATLTPSMPRAVRRQKAEEAWLNTGLPVHLFRLAGIYGPGRNPLVNLQQGKARRINKPGQFFSRIHVADIVTTLDASINRPNPQSIYNVCDDEPAPPQDVVEFAATLTGIAPPPLQNFATANLSPMARSFYLDNRRVSNQKIKHELGVQLQYPDYRSGLQALHRSQHR